MISADELLVYCDAALDEYAAICRELGDDLVSSRPDGLPSANSAFALVTHVAGVMARWGRTVNRGIVVPRDRAAEFVATGTVEEALAVLEAARARFHEDVAATAFREPPANPHADWPEPGYETQGGILLHVYEELAQHLGQLEVTRDLLVAHRGRADHAR
ncbi:DUF664 domain-containing protein [Phycicoccus sonneratiae]|uniref:DUF664 domain-containing protein n=1 Tax=Phycicoccus sonneratiae TaxID=2807628 RepID=A0ABS2CKZ7_9MICO|nr:DUF664 domain-containing protein [Phycicoccus sonneraticus]MBM6400561.1 DUF664 domain-containing protein [Phycicoccus sonneraticus]